MSFRLSFCLKTPVYFRISLKYTERNKICNSLTFLPHEVAPSSAPFDNEIHVYFISERFVLQRPFVKHYLFSPSLPPAFHPPFEPCHVCPGAAADVEDSGCVGGSEWGQPGGWVCWGVDMEAGGSANERADGITPRWKGRDVFY